MAKSSLAGVFTEYDLTYQVEGAQTGTDAYGNPVYGTTTQTLRVRLNAYQFGQLTYALGADDRHVRGKGACVDPYEFPDGIGVGKTFDLTWGGTAGQMTITQVDETPLAVLREVVGQEFQWSWRPSDG